LDVREFSSLSELTGYFSKALRKRRYTLPSSAVCTLVEPATLISCSSFSSGISSEEACLNDGNMKETILFKVFLGSLLLIRTFYLPTLEKSTGGKA